MDNAKQASPTDKAGGTGKKLHYRIERDLRKMFNYRKPTRDSRRRLAIIAQDTMKLAEAIDNVMPECPEKDEALRLLRQCKMTTNAGIVTNQAEEEKRDDVADALNYTMKLIGIDPAKGVDHTARLVMGPRREGKSTSAFLDALLRSGGKGQLFTSDMVKPGAVIHLVPGQSFEDFLKSNFGTHAERQPVTEEMKAKKEKAAELVKRSALNQLTNLMMQVMNNESFTNIQQRETIQEAARIITDLGGIATTEGAAFLKKLGYPTAEKPKEPAAGAGAMQERRVQTGDTVYLSIGSNGSYAPGRVVSIYGDSRKVDIETRLGTKFGVVFGEEIGQWRWNMELSSAKSRISEPPAPTPKTSDKPEPKTQDGRRPQLGDDVFVQFIGMDRLEGKVTATYTDTGRADVTYKLNGQEHTARNVPRGSGNNHWQFVYPF